MACTLPQSRKEDILHPCIFHWQLRLLQNFPFKSGISLTAGLCTYSLCTRWLRRSWVTCSCQDFLVPVAEMGAAVGRLPIEPTADPSDSSWLEVEQDEGEQTRWEIVYSFHIWVFDYSVKFYQQLHKMHKNMYMSSSYKCQVIQNYYWRSVNTSQKLLV